MKKLSEEDLLAVARTHGVETYDHPEMKGIAMNSFYMGCLAAKESKSKKMRKDTIKKKAQQFAENAYGSEDRQEISVKSFTEGVKYLSNLK